MAVTCNKIWLLKCYVVSATSEFFVGVYSLGAIRVKEQLLNAYIVEMPECITYSYHWTLAWNL